MTSQFDFSSLPVVRQKSITGADLAEEPQFDSIRDERALMASEGLSEHLESALVAAGGGDAPGWITEMNENPSGLRYFPAETEIPVASAGVSVLLDASLSLEAFHSA